MENILQIISMFIYIYRLFEFLSVKLILVPVKLLVILITSIILGFGLYGLTLLKMEFRPEWMLDPETECRNTNIIVESY